MTFKVGNYSSAEDQLLCEYWIQISEDPEVGIYQPRNILWARVTAQYNVKVASIGFPPRPQRLVGCRLEIILSAIAKFKACYKEVERLHPSGANENDILNRVRSLYKDDPSTKKKSFKFDHIWETMRDIDKYATISQRTRRDTNISSSHGMPDSPLSPSLELFSFEINLSDENASKGSTSVAARPKGMKNTKLKRKICDDIAIALNVLQSENEKIREMMTQNAIKRDQSVALLEEKQNQKVASRKQMADTNTRKDENKILMIDVDSISDFT